MATITGLTAERMAEIEGASIVSGQMVDGNLILTRHDGTEIDAGPVSGPAGPPGPQNTGIPGEVKLWPSDTLPNPTTYGLWVWADGMWYVKTEHPLAFANLRDQWDEFAGASDPGDPNFRVPDLRGLVPAGLDSMPSGSQGSADRMTRLDADILAKKTGKEMHMLIESELAAHDHDMQVTGLHGHYISPNYGTLNVTPYQWGRILNFAETLYPSQPFYGVNSSPGGGGNVSAEGNHSHDIYDAGGNGAHENVQPTVMVPYIVCLDEV